MVAYCERDARLGDTSPAEKGKGEGGAFSGGGWWGAGCRCREVGGWYAGEDCVYVWVRVGDVFGEGEVGGDGKEEVVAVY